MRYPWPVYRLVAYAPDGVRRFPVHRQELVIGSEGNCDVVLPYTGVAKRHARVRLGDDGLSIEDLGSRRGTQVSGRRVQEAELEVLDEIRLGGVTLLVEDVVADSGEVRLPATEDEPEPVMTPERLVEHLERVSDWVLADAESRTTLESLASRVLEDFGGGVLFLLQGEAESVGVKFVVGTQASWLSHGEELQEQVEARRQDGQAVAPFLGPMAGREVWIFSHVYRALGRRYLLLIALPRFRSDGWSPEAGLRALGDLLILGLVHHVGHFEPILPGKQAEESLSLNLARGLVVGESPLMEQALNQLKGALDPPVNVLLRGEPGVGKELFAHTLHLSGPQRSGPFVIASAADGSPAQVEADLFGAELTGKDGPVRRRGKLLLADGGTLYLQDLDRLPLDLQGRLVRFLRSGEVEPKGGAEAHKVSVRLVASSRQPLEPLVARDQVRVDLAYRLSQVVISVPPLKDRRQDLPLLIQGQINRFCHETGKRVQGIAVKAMTSLLNYDYPGNLAELENIARHMVNRCPSGQPIEVSMLPEAARLSPIRAAARVDSASDLDLERLLADTERAALREALRRCRGNKSQTARMVGLSRNGLAMKLQRHGLTA